MTNKARSGLENAPDAPTPPKVWAMIRKAVLCHLGAAFASFVVLLVVQSPVGAHGIGPGVFLALTFLLFPLLPLFFFPLSFVEFGLHSSECLEKMGSCAVPLIAYCTVFVAVFVGLWKLIPLRPFNKSSLKPSSNKSRFNIESGRIAASAHLLDPTYVVDYAKAEGLKLDDIFTLVRKGQMFSYWHKGILFVAQSKIDEPNPSLQGTRDEAALP